MVSPSAFALRGPGSETGTRAARRDSGSTAKRRVRFTRAELEAIIDMAAIASAQCGPEGDYQEWDDKVFDAAATAAIKAHEMLRSRSKSPSPAGLPAERSDER